MALSSTKGRKAGKRPGTRGRVLVVEDDPVLALAIVREGSKAVAAGMNPLDVKRGIDLAVGAVFENLEAHA